MIILIGGEKGGTGKTTIATNLAALALIRNMCVCLLDTDQQRSSGTWSSLRDTLTDYQIPHIATFCQYGSGVRTAATELASRYNLVIIDAGGRDNAELGYAMQVAHKLIIPCIPSSFDLWTMSKMAELVETAGMVNPSLKVGVVFNRVHTNQNVRSYKDATEYLEQQSWLSPLETVLHDRVAYQRAAAGGLSVVEGNHVDFKAQLEVEQLFREVFV